MSNWISFPNYPPMEMLLRPCSSLDQSVPFSLDRWFPLDLTSEAPTDGQDSPSSMTIGGGGEVLPAVGGAVSSDSTEVTVSGANGKSSESLTVVDGSVNGNAKALTAVTSPVKAFGHRSSIYRGVTKHRWTGRYEAHLWDNTCKIEGQKRKGRQVYLGGYDVEQKAARAYDLAALKYWGPSATTNFPVSDYSKEMEIMKNMTQPEFIASIRRNSSGFSRGASIYRGVTRHHQQGRWQARIGRVAGNKDLYLGTFSTEEEAAEAYDIAAIKFRGSNAVTNFELSRYNVEAIANNELPVGSSSNRRRKTAILEPMHTNFELNEYNIQAVADSKQLTIAPTKRTKHSFEGNNYNLPPLAFTTSNVVVSNLDLSMYNLECFTNNEQMVAFEGNIKPEVPMTANSMDNSVSLAHYGLGETNSDPCGQSLYWFGGNGQYHTGQINQLTLEASQ